MGFIKFLFLYIIVYMIYIESHPDLGNIWMRTGSDNEKHFSLYGLLSVIFAPFKIFELWLPYNWDINFMFGLLVILIIFYKDVKNTLFSFYKFFATFDNNEKYHNYST
jgi:hypothetical protein